MNKKLPNIAGYATRPEIAKRLAIDKRTLIRWHKLGIGPPVTLLGRTPVYSEESFLAWLADREQKPPKPRRARRIRARQTENSKVRLGAV